LLSLPIADSFGFPAKAATTSHPALKSLFLGLASEYRELAQQIDDPVQWRAKRAAIEPQSRRQ
jgi:hypothetical protein